MIMGKALWLCWRSEGTDHPLALCLGIVLNVSVLPGQAAASHGSHVVRMRMTLDQLVSHIESVVRSEAPFQILVTDAILDDGWTQNVSQSDPLLFAVLAWGRFIPIPRNEVTVQSVAQIDSANDNSPHTEGAVGVDGVFLEISVHFVWNCMGDDVLGLP